MTTDAREIWERLHRELVDRAAREGWSCARFRQAHDAVRSEFWINDEPQSLNLQIREA